MHGDKPPHFTFSLSNNASHRSPVCTEYLSFFYLLTSRKGHSRYRDPKTFEMTPALYRVRKPFFWKNMAGLLLATSVPLGVYMYTINVLSQDDFADIPIPPISDDELAKLKKEYEEKK